MACLLFSLRGVPNDEANEIRDLLLEHNIDFYETSAGNWGISMPAIWLTDSEQLFAANELLNQYHQTRESNQREQYQKLVSEGENKTIYDAFLENPLRFLFFIFAFTLILYASIKLVLDFGL